VGGVFKDITGAAFIIPLAAMESMKPPTTAPIKEILSFMNLPGRNIALYDFLKIIDF
jgi:hypothetical protein